jgi:hypothetical protein
VKPLCKTAPVWCGFLGILCLLVLTVRADIPGGSGKPQTPYRDPRNVNAEEVTTVREIAGRCRQGKIPFKSPGGDTLVAEIFFAYGQNNDTLGVPLYQLKGEDAGGKPVTVELSDVLTFSVADFRQGECLLKVTVFPTISVEELLAQNPTYSDLKLRYTREVGIWVKTISDDGRLFVCGRTWDGKPKLGGLLTDVKPNAEVELKYGYSRDMGGRGTVWYAIQSVIEDRNYPYRVLMAE